jgi:hypothetical protein
MEGWRQERLGSRQELTEKKRRKDPYRKERRGKKNIRTGKKEKHA